MKVTVCFGNVRVVVPCGDGDLLVRDLIREATHRYKKATGKGTDSWVAVHNLQSQSGGGILDPDDRLNDVADDREQIIANFEDGDGVHHGGGDGASGSSIGTASPDIFHDPDHKYTGSAFPSRTDIEVTGEQIASGMLTVPLQVRRGSEPALHQLPTTGVEPPGPRPPALQDPTKRWSAAPIILGDLTTATATLAKTTDDHSQHLQFSPSSLRGGAYQQYNGTNGYLSPDWSKREHEEDDDDNDEDGTPFSRIARDGSNRLSMQFLANGSGYRWADAAERTAQYSSTKHRIHVSSSLPRDHRRKEPLGQANNSTNPAPSSAYTNLIQSRLAAPEADPEEDNFELIVIRNELGPLGIHVVPDYDRFGKDRGLVVQGIEPGGRIDRDGRLTIYDRIIEINGQNLLNLPFQRIQEMFKLSLIATELRLKVIKHRSNGDQIRKPPAPVYPKTGVAGRFPDDKENVAMVEVEEQLSLNTKVATVSPTKKIPASSRNLKSLLTANTRKIGRKIELELTKGIHGLGFSITTRDNPAGGNCPIYIKNILPKGAAVEDGRLKPGDRLLEVNNIEMTGKSQAEAVAVLRNAPAGSKVKIVVSRQEDVNNESTLPREIGAESSDVAKISTHNNYSTHKLNISSSNSSSMYPQNNPSPPAIPPLPDSVLSRNKNATPERTGSVAKIISQFQEAAKSNTSHPPEKCNDDNLIFPWKHREILTFDIPVHDTEKAGLGVSVKGKTTQNTNGSGSADLGIFVKSVIHGGAASRDKRLRMNDQLLNVNGVSLLQQSNSEAMETLRRAMLHTEGPVPGSITLTIARRASSPGPVTNGNVSNSSPANTLSRDTNTLLTISDTAANSNINNSTEMEISTTDNSGTSESSGNTVIFLPYNKHSDNSLQSLNQSQQSRNGSYINNWNPVIDRITGQSKNHNVQLRNESYYMATHDTWNTSLMTNTTNTDKYTSPTVNLPSGETVIIEEEYSSSIPSVSISLNKNNDVALENRNDTEPDGKASVSSSTCDKTTNDSSNGASGTEGTNNTDVTYASQLSLENPAGFSRDAFGRQSMSEKRHATLDAKSTGTYQRNKKLREEREKTKPKENPNIVRVGSVESIISLNRSPIHQHPEYADKLGQLGPSLGMKKSSSLESLQTMVQEIQMQEESDPAYSYRGGQGALKVIRGRGCDESFRAAVDVDYNKHLVDPNHLSETNAKKHWLLDPPEGSTNEREIDGFSNVRGGPRQSSLNAVLDSKHKAGGKKKPGILKGIGSMFRFGKHRKTDSNSSTEHHYTENITQHEPETIQEHQSSDNSQINKELENQIPEEQQLSQPSHQSRQRQLDHHYQQQQQQISSNNNAAAQKYYVRIDNDNNMSTSTTRSEKVHHLRTQHQQRHAERQGQYPNDEREEHYEQVIRQRIEQPNSYDSFRQMGRPGSRSGISDPVRFNQYVNYDELQHQLSTRKDQLSENQIVQMRMQVQQQRLKVEEESRKQHQYHSQRQPRSELHQRPVSNFYEYESVQSFMHSRGRQPSSIGQQQNHHEDDVNSNSLSRQQQSQQQQSHQQQATNRHQHLYIQQRTRPYHTNSSNPHQQRYVQHQQQGRLRGPFVTHVTIGNDVNKSAGSKV